MIVIGHRGARGLAPENTKAAIQKAFDYSVDAIELDVRVTADAIPVLHHDPKVIVDGQDTAICELSFKDLKRSKRDIMTLDEALRFIGGKIATIIEIKPGEILEPIITCIQNRLHNEWKRKDLKIASFSLPVLKTIHEDLPSVTLVVNEKWSGVRASSRARKLGTEYVCMNQKWLWGGFIRSFSKSYKLSAYTLNDSAKAQKWAKKGLYGAVTDNPDKF